MKHISLQPTFLLKRIAIVLGGGMLVIAALFFRIAQVHAFGQFYGGMKTSVFTCSCTGNQLIYINDYKSHGQLALVYQSGASKLYSNNNIFGTYLLGSYSSGGSCQYYVGEDCVEMQSDGQFDSNPGTGTS